MNIWFYQSNSHLGWLWRIVVFVINYKCFETLKYVIAKYFKTVSFLIFCFLLGIIMWYFSLLSTTVSQSSSCTFSSIHLLLLLLLYLQFTLELNIIIQLYIIYQTDPLLLSYYIVLYSIICYKEKKR